MADNWISQMFVNAVSAPVANAVASAGGMAGGAVGSVGNGINSIGASIGSGIERSIRYYGDGVKDYGNALQDWTKASGPRQGTASNPLGLSGNQVSGKMAFTGGPRSKATEVKKSTAFSQPRLPAPVQKKPAAKSSQPAKKSAVVATKTITPAKSSPAKNGTKAPTAKPKTPANGAVKGNTPQKKSISAESRPQKPKAAVAAPRKTYTAKNGTADNPLGLNF